MITLLVLEGPDGVGKTRHVDRLAAVIGARAFHHRQPKRSPDAVAHALDYAAQRRDLITTAIDGEIIVADRWITSTDILRMALPRGPESRALGRIVEMERALYRGDDAPKAYRKRQAFLRAPAAVLDARLRERGREPTVAELEIRASYTHWVEYDGSAVAFDTGQDFDAVADELLAWARGVLS